MTTSIYSKTSTQSAIQVNGVDSIVFDSTGILFGAPVGFRNKIINGNFVINQRVVSGTVTLGANSYGHDRFKSGAGGCTYTFSASANGMILNITAGTLLQIIEGANLEGGSMKLSWFGTSSGRVDIGGYGASGVVGTAVAGTNQTVEFGVGTLARVQYELGTVATTFEQKPLGLELALCQRYYYSGTFYYEGYAAAGSGPVVGTNNNFPVTMRVSPTTGYGTFTNVQNATTGATRVISASAIFRYCLSGTTGQVTAYENYIVSAEL